MGGKVLLGPNCKLEIAMYLVQQIFQPGADVILRIRLQIEKESNS